MISSPVTVEEVTKMDQEVYEAFRSLVPQLSSSSLLPAYEQLDEIVTSPATHLFVARDQNTKQIIGSLTLVMFRIPTGLRAWIEDVIVDSKARKKGIGKELCAAAIKKAQAFGVRTIDLTSRPSREAANRLYQSVGFAMRETNVYRFNMEK